MPQCFCQGRQGEGGRDGHSGESPLLELGAAEEAAPALDPRALRAEALLGARGDQGGLVGKTHVH